MFTVAPGYEFKKPVRQVSVKKPIRDKVKTDMKVRFSTAEARDPSLLFGVFLLLSLSVTLACLSPR